MKIKEIIRLLDATVLNMPEGFEESEVHSVCGSDMMSDVLAYVKDEGMLLTGLNNPQVVRTAEMMDMNVICFVRGKKPDEIVINLAKEKNIALLATDKTMFVACGKLYEAGLK